MTEREVIKAIETITRETGFAPDADELAAALHTEPRLIHQALIHAKTSKRVRYDEDERFVLA